MRFIFVLLPASPQGPIHDGSIQTASPKKKRRAWASVETRGRMAQNEASFAWSLNGGGVDGLGYLYRTAFNRWKRLSRRATRQLGALAGIVDRTDEFANVDNQDAIDRALGALTPRQRAAIVLTEVLGYSSPEAAKIMGIRDVPVGALASQGRGTLRRILESYDE